MIYFLTWAHCGPNWDLVRKKQGMRSLVTWAFKRSPHRFAVGFEGVCAQRLTELDELAVHENSISLLFPAPATAHSCCPVSLHQIASSLGRKEEKVRDLLLITDRAFEARNASLHRAFSQCRQKHLNSNSDTAVPHPERRWIILPASRFYGTTMSLLVRCPPADRSGSVGTPPEADTAALSVLFEIFILE